MHEADQTLPVHAVLPALCDALAQERNCVLVAAPGAGKTTRVPLALLEQGWMRGRKLIMLEPRRLAARRSAEYIAFLLGERPGQTVGYRIRGESRVSAATRVEVVTEGVLTRMLHDDPGLSGTALVLFDEFHERSIHADLGLALTLDVQAQLRSDLRVLVMSATLDGAAVARLLGGVPVIESEGRVFPVETRYAPFMPEGRLESRVRDAVVRALWEEGEGDLLVFLPGQREIRRVEEMLTEARVPNGVLVHTLYGEAPQDRQRAALAPAPRGERKVILSTSISETSLTIDGVRIVVDAGLSRVSRFDPRRGMEGLVTIPVSRASADQRRGRAGRQAPGVCYRLWTQEQEASLPGFSTPEILNSDLAPFALDLALWGDPQGSGLRFLDPPPPAHLTQARELLERLGALDSAGALTPHGRSLATLPVHPRLAHMIVRGKDLGAGGVACELAALLEERDLLRGRQDTDIDLVSRLRALRQGGGVDRGVQERVQAEARRLCSLAKAAAETGGEEDLGLLLALAYPERVARRRGEEGGRFQMAGGTGALVPDWSAMAREKFLAIGEVDGVGVEVRVFLAAPLTEEDILKAFADRLEQREEVQWDPQTEAVAARVQTRLDALVLEERQVTPPAEAMRAAMLEGVRQLGLEALPWDKEADSLRARSEWLRRSGLAEEDWPDLSSEHLLKGLDEWLGPFLEGIWRRAHLTRLQMTVVLRSLLSHKQLQDLNRMAPTELVVPTGSHIRIQYEGVTPVLAVRLQEMYGQRETPAVGGGRVPVLIHLLSPAGRPLAVTQDLPSFWKNVYPEVRKEMRGRYPKHPWPEDPLRAAPTRRAKSRR